VREALIIGMDVPAHGGVSAFGGDHEFLAVSERIRRRRFGLRQCIEHR
jgi:hypothetical protein